MEEAQLAQECFARGDYRESLAALLEVKAARADDPKVAHNLALVEYFAGGCVDTQGLLHKLTACQAHAEELARLSAAQLETLSQGEAAPEAPEGARATEAAFQQSQQPPTPLLTDCDAALPALNAAVLLWQTGHRAAAAALAEPLARIMEALPREAALRLALLLLDVHLQAGRSEPSARVIAQLEALLRDGGPSIDQALTLHVAKARLHFLCGAPKAARRELKSASATAAAAGSWAGPGALLASLQSSFLKAKEEMGKGNHRKASRLLAAGGAVAGDAAPTQLRSLFAAGGGALLHSLRKHETASLAYARALRLAVEAQTQPAESHSTAHLSSTQLDQLCYAAGVQHLLCGKYELAGACLQAVAPRLGMHLAPLWLRLAECCLGVHESSHQAPIHPVVGVVGEGPLRCVMLASGSPLGSPAPTDAQALLRCQADLGACGGERALSLAYAAQCLRNCEAVLDGPQEGERAPRPDWVPQTHAAGELVALRCSLLAARAYLALLLGAARPALAAAQELLSQAEPHAAPEQCLLAHSYAAEALCLLDRPEEALEHLSGCLLELPDEQAMPEQHHQQQQQQGTAAAAAATCDAGEAGGGDADESVGAAALPAAGTASLAALRGAPARAALYVNLAAVYGSQGELDAAHDCAVRAAALAPACLPALLALVYVQLAKGGPQGVHKALQLLRRRSPPPPAGVTAQPAWPMPEQAAARAVEPETQQQGWVPAYSAHPGAQPPIPSVVLTEGWTPAYEKGRR